MIWLYFSGQLPLELGFGMDSHQVHCINNGTLHHRMKIPECVNINCRLDKKIDRRDASYLFCGSFNVFLNDLALNRIKPLH